MDREPAELRWLRSHLQLCVQAAFGAEQVQTDADGDYPFRWDTAACWVSLCPGPAGSPARSATVAVSATALVGVRRTARLLRELSDLTAANPLVRVRLTSGAVVVDAALPAVALAPDALHRLCVEVGGTAASVAPLLSALFGGDLPFPPEDPAADTETASDPETPGL